jgi:chromosomal replication initiation ATPase DnaA
MSALQAQHETWKAARVRLMAPKREKEIASAVRCAELPSRFSIEERIPKYRLQYFGASEIAADAWGVKAPAGKLIIRTVAEHYDVPMIEMLSARRQRAYAFARQVACYLMHEMTSLSYPQIGRLMGGRDHTTALHAFRKIWGLVNGDRTFATEVDVIRQKILTAMAAAK